jgi:hypothetical protein
MGNSRCRPFPREHSRCPHRSNRNSLDLIERDFIAGAIIQLRRARAFVRRHELRVPPASRYAVIPVARKVWQPILTFKPRLVARRSPHFIIDNTFSHVESTWSARPRGEESGR